MPAAAGSYPGGRRITQECVIGVTTLRDIPHHARDRCDIALTLSQVPVERDGSADGVLQTGQRIGSAAIAVTG
jgi:hypothetical protein